MKLFGLSVKKLLLIFFILLVFGRSIGSGPACYLASMRKPKALILMSPYTSIKVSKGPYIN
jgi:hypothetical protein